MRQCLVLLFCHISVVCLESFSVALQLAAPVSVSEIPLSPLPRLPPGYRPFAALQSKLAAKGKKMNGISTSSHTTSVSTSVSDSSSNDDFIVVSVGDSGGSSSGINTNNAVNSENNRYIQRVFQPAMSFPISHLQQQQGQQQTRSEDKVSDAEILALLTNETETRNVFAEGQNSDEDYGLEESGAFLYDQNAFRSWNIEMAERDVESLNADPTKEKSYPCSITSMYGTSSAQKHSFSGLGCRYKGSVGSLRLCVDENHRLNHNCRKLTWAVATDGIKSQVNRSLPLPTIHGAESLFFGGCPVDWSMMSERMAYTLLNSVNVSAPQAVHAKLFLNGKFLGVYSFVQPIDRIFTQQRYKSDRNKGKGGLYKEVWFNKYSMDGMRVHEGVQEDMFMKRVMHAIERSPQNKVAATRLLEKYFDTQSLVDVTAFNSVIGNTDDWRQRHNFYWYVRDDDEGQKKLVLLPWDYDRLYDAEALTRGVLAGNPWWDIKKTTNPQVCNAAIETPEALANQTANSPKELDLWISIYRSLPPDLEIPVSCDKITKLLALALGPRVRARTREFLNIISLQRIQIWFNTWNEQLELAMSYDPDGPNPNFMRAEQAALLIHLTNARELALQQADEGDRVYALKSAR